MWVAVGNNGVPNELTKSYRLVFTSTFSKETIKSKLNQDELRRIGMQVEEWEWRNPLADPFANRAALKASDDAGRSLELAYSGAEGFDAEGESQSFKDLNNTEGGRSPELSQRSTEGGSRRGSGPRWPGPRRLQLRTQFWPLLGQPKVSWISDWHN